MTLEPTRSIGLAAILAIALGGCRGDDPKKVADDAARPTAGYTVATVEHAGTITGRVSVEGEMPAMNDFAIGDQAACAQAAKNNRVQVDSGGGIALVVVYLDGVRRGKPMPALPAEDLTIDQRGCQYSPHVVVAPLGSTVAFVNSDDIAHNVRVQSGATDSMMLNRAQPVRGRRDTMRVETTGPASVGCDYHPWMNAYVFGVDNPYYALTAPDGTFTIAGIPPGTYTLRLWLNGAGFQARTDNQGKVIRYAFADPYTREQTVKVEPDGTARVGFAIPLVRGRKG